MTAGVNHITFAVSDLQRSLRFYVEVLGCTKVATWTGGAYLRAGDMWLCLSLASAASEPVPRDYTHVAFTFDAESLAAFRERLSAFQGREWKTNTSEGDSVYFLDPDGHRLEAHVGSLESRLASLRESLYEGLELHDDPRSGIAADTRDSWGRTARTFFERYEQLFNRALAGRVDMDQVVALYASEFIASSPAGVMAGKNDDRLKQVMAEGYARYRAMGTKQMRVRDVRVSAIDEYHCVAHVGWTATYARDDRSDVAIDFDVHYFMRRLNGDPKVFGCVSGDEQEASSEVALTQPAAFAVVREMQ